MKIFRPRNLLATGALFITMNVLPTLAAAESRENGRFAISLGTWSGNFSQSNTAQTVSLTAPISPGASLQLGLNFSFIFIEYNLTYLGSVAANFNNSSYHSYFGGNLGVDLPALPLEVYVGLEKGTHPFSSGSKPAFYGTAYKVGAQLILRKSTSGRIAIQGEYRHHSIHEDEAGALPSDLSTVSKTYFVGISFGLTQGK